ncbi:hypothetical protein NQ318_021745 [Aromia moschata]|uniref:CID domain-containing protein n=1 Tax=Aromia moschata TaxID=1265417 RepID=A0AAV8XZC3_9CUCU|nr:hypothetical protein NQ318_021745 [Aromia moschata]
MTYYTFKRTVIFTKTILRMVSTDVKLPILYLIDCIVKNVGGTYTTLFSQNIVSTFCGVFKAVDEKTRAEMFKLRQTWNDVFPQMKLYAIDVQINLLDPAWPVTAKPPSNSIHFNPKFLKTTTASKPKLETETSQIITTSVPGSINKETLLMQEKLIQKQKELLELQQKKLELEVLQTQVKLQEQIKNNVPVVSLPVRPQNVLLKPEVAKQLVPSALKNKPTGISATPSLQQRQQTNVNTGPRINPVGSALVSARPIRDPRLLRQQQKPNTNNSNVQLGQKTSVLENNKIVKMNIRKIRNDPRLLNKDDNILSQKIDTNKPSNLNKSVKGSAKNRNYMRRNIGVISPEPPQDEDLRSFGPPEKQPRLQSDSSDIQVKITEQFGLLRLGLARVYFKFMHCTIQDKICIIYLSLASYYKVSQISDGTTVPVTKSADVDLRQLPSITGKKRSSTETSDQGSTKKTKTEIFDNFVVCVRTAAQSGEEKLYLGHHRLSDGA